MVPNNLCSRCLEERFEDIQAYLHGPSLPRTPSIMLRVLDRPVGLANSTLTDINPAVPKAGLAPDLLLWMVRSHGGYG